MEEKFGLTSGFVDRALNRVKPFIEAALESRLTNVEPTLAVVVTTVDVLKAHPKNGLLQDEDCLLITRLGNDTEFKKLRLNRQSGSHEPKWDFCKRQAFYALAELAGRRQRSSQWYITERGASSLNGVVVSCAGVPVHYSEMFSWWISSAIIAETYCGT